MAVRPPSETELLALWENGLIRHPIDQSLLLCAWAQPEPQPIPLADLPLGCINVALLRLRAACFGPHLEAYTDCEACGERLTLPLEVNQLLAGVAPGDPQSRIEVGGLLFRAATSRDLAAVIDHPDQQSAARELLSRCFVTCVDAPLPMVADLPPELIGEVEAGLEALDPAADIGLSVACGSCGHGWVAGLDIGALLWEEIACRARELLVEVHQLARTYGWREPEILALSPQRRAAYLNLVGA